MPVRSFLYKNRSFQAANQQPVVLFAAMHIQESGKLQSEFFRFTSSIRNLIILPEGTCCHRAAQYFLSEIVSARQSVASVEIITVASFAQGKDKLEQMTGGEEILMLIPDINEANKFVMQVPGWNWVPNLSFALPNPPLHYAKANTTTASNYLNRCATIPELHPLLKNNPQFNEPSNFEFYDVLTTQDAAMAVLEGQANYCITNEAGLTKSKNRLNSVLRLQQMTVFWKLFYYKPF